MKSIETDLFILLSDLSQLKDRESIIEFYLKELNKLLPDYGFKWSDELTSDYSFPLRTNQKIYGYIQCTGEFDRESNDATILENSGKLLSIILENLEHESVLKNHNKDLLQKVDDQTSSLLRKQNELNKLNEEYATLNDELQATNESLTETNAHLEKTIVENKHNLTQLEQSETYFRNIFDHSSVGNSITSLDGKLQVNNVFCEILGYSKEELKGLHWKEITHPDDIEYNEKIISEILKGKYSRATWQKRYLHKNGEIVWANISTSLQRDEKNKPLFFITTIANITKQIETEQELRKLNAYFESLFNHSSSPIMVWDFCFVITQFNDAFEKISGYRAKEVLGKNIDVLFSSDSIENALEYLARTHEGELLEGVELEITRKNGEKRTLVWNTAPIFDNENNVSATVAQGNDITSLKEAFDKIKEVEQRQTNIIDGTRAGTWEWNVQTGKTIFNETWAKIVGYTLKELEPVSIDTWMNLSHPDDLIRSNQLLEKHFKGESDYYEMEGRMKHKNGHWVWVLDRGKVTSWDENGQPLLMYGTHQDITIRKNAEIALKDSEQLLIESQTISLIGSYVLDINAGIWKASKMLHDIFGINEDDDHSVEGWLNIVHPEDREIMQDHFFNEVVGQKKRFNKEYRIISINDRKEKWVHGIGKLELDSKGNPVRMIGTIQDISERKKVVTELSETNELLTQFVLHSPIYAFIKEVTPTESRVIKASENYKEMIGLPGSEMIGKNMFELFPKEFAEQMTADDWEVVKNGISLKTDEDLNDRHYTSIKFPIKLGNKNLLAGYTIDITDRKQAEIMVKLKNEELTVANRKLKKAKEKAEESDRLKSFFLANMSHEIRTPLNSIMGFASLLPDEDAKELVDKYAQIIVQNSEQLVSIIDGIVLYSKLQTGLMQCNPGAFSVDSVCKEIIQSFSLPEIHNNVELIFSPKVETSVEIINDYDKLRQILANLITNALKYTSQGSIQIGYVVHKKKIEFLVKDTGIGVPKKEQDKIFDRFYRGSNVDQTSIRGTGLGLSIVKELVELLGGKIWIESEVGTGTTFHFTIQKELKTDR